MAATVTLDGTNVTLADTITGWGQLRIRGSGGLPTISDSTDVFLQGGHAVTSRTTASRLWLYYDLGSGLNFSTTHAGKHVSIWANCLASGLLQLSTYVSGADRGGLCICLGSSTANYSYWNMGGSDTYSGGWVRLTIDPSKTASGTGGTGLDLTSVRYFGIIFDTSAAAKFDNAIVDRIDYGFGLIAKGTSTSGKLFSDILAADEGDATNGKFGYVRSDQGTYYVQGLLTLGDSTGATACTFTDNDSIVVFEKKQYRNSSSAWVDAVSTTFHGIKRVGNATNGTSLTFGTKVGTGDTAKGRNGVLIASNGQPVTIDLDDANAGSGNVLKVYGSTFRGISGTFAYGPTTSFEFIGNTVDQCAQVTDMNGAIVRNCIFSGTVSTSGALAWGANMDIKNSDFIANTIGAAILHASATGSPFSYDKLIFSGNTYDVNNTSGSSITVNKNNAANPSIYTGSTVTFAATYTLTIDGFITGSDIVVYEAGTTNVLDDDQEHSGTSWGYVYAAADSIDIGIFLAGYIPLYLRAISIPEASSTLPVKQVVDRAYLA